MSNESNDQARVKSLIDEAAARVGDKKALAKLLKYSPGNVYDWSKGTRACPVQAQALMADIAGLSAQEVACYVVIQQEKNPERKARLLEVLGKASRRMSAACWAATSVSAALVFSALTGMPRLHTMYIM
ncbi:hypothetical protein [Ramlibacter sp.]|uniref:hypothetical protein n=1 Tax=Ramlibacter sp. TaxID=1917967 RepID=UPI001800C30D|nr:hypothetical protein [Ramlibacter sp.]MBA2676139.1 hypothetical protein [Ramlibacter sp.]